MLKLCFLSLSLLLIFGAQLTACDRNDRRHLVLHHRLFSQFLDKARLQSYLSSFGENVSGSQQHRIYKRAPARIRKVKLNENKAASESVETKVSKKATTAPRMIKFEIEDAKYNEEYEQMRKSRKSRVRRSTDNSTRNGSFREPKEILKFSLADVIFATQETSSVSSSSSANHKKENKAKREIKSENSDTETDSSKSHIKISHPLSSSRKNRFVSFDDLPSGLRKSIESAINDVQKKVPDGDYLKFYYGDKIIKIPQSMWKYISSKARAETKPVKFPPVEETVEEEHKKSEYSEVFGTKTYYATTYRPTATTVEKAKSYVNFESPKEHNVVYKKVEKAEEEEVVVPKKSFYFYAPPPTIATPALKYQSAPIRETIPISEDIDEHQSYVPVYQTLEQKPTLKSLPLPTPTSYVEYSDNKYTNAHEHEHEPEHKNYEFGYHVTDYKSGNNFGHTQSKKQNVINGQYSILLPDGRIQITKYIADDSGFHADITYQNIH